MLEHIPIDLLRAAALASDDDTPRLAIADWFDENGRPNDAHYVRSAVRAGRLGHGRARHGAVASGPFMLGNRIFGYAGFRCRWRLGLPDALQSERPLTADALPLLDRLCTLRELDIVLGPGVSAADVAARDLIDLRAIRVGVDAADVAWGEYAALLRLPRLVRVTFHRVGPGPWEPQHEHLTRWHAARLEQFESADEPTRRYMTAAVAQAALPEHGREGTVSVVGRLDAPPAHWLRTCVPAETFAEHPLILRPIGWDGAAWESWRGVQALSVAADERFDPAWLRAFPELRSLELTRGGRLFPDSGRLAEALSRLRHLAHLSLGVPVADASGLAAWLGGSDCPVRVLEFGRETDASSLDRVPGVIELSAWGDRAAFKRMARASPNLAVVRNPQLRLTQGLTLLREGVRGVWWEVGHADGPGIRTDAEFIDPRPDWFLSQARWRHHAPALPVPVALTLPERLGEPVPVADGWEWREWGTPADVPHRMAAACVRLTLLDATLIPADDPAPELWPDRLSHAESVEPPKSLSGGGVAVGWRSDLRRGVRGHWRHRDTAVRVDASWGRYRAIDWGALIGAALERVRVGG